MSLWAVYIHNLIKAQGFPAFRVNWEASYRLIIAVNNICLIPFRSTYTVVLQHRSPLKTIYLVIHWFNIRTGMELTAWEEGAFSTMQNRVIFIAFMSFMTIYLIKKHCARVYFHGIVGDGHLAHLIIHFGVIWSWLILINIIIFPKSRFVLFDLLGALLTSLNLENPYSGYSYYHPCNIGQNGSSYHTFYNFDPRQGTSWVSGW